MTETPGVRSRVASAISFVIRSRTTTTIAATTNSRRGAPATRHCPEPCEASTAFAIFLFLFAGDAKPRVRQGVEPLKVDLLPALMAVPELVGRAVQTPQRLIHVPQIAALLGREEKLLLPLHGVGALIGHMERIGREIAVGRLQGRVEGFIVIAQLLHHASPLFDQALLQMCQLFLIHYSSMVEADSFRPS